MHIPLTMPPYVIIAVLQVFPYKILFTKVLFNKKYYRHIYLGIIYISVCTLKRNIFL